MQLRTDLVDVNGPLNGALNGGVWVRDAKVILWIAYSYKN